MEAGTKKPKSVKTNEKNKLETRKAMIMNKGVNKALMDIEAHIFPFYHPEEIRFYFKNLTLSWTFCLLNI